MIMSDSDNSECEWFEDSNNSEECSLNLSFESSDYDTEVIERQAGIQPYQFEPEVDGESSPSSPASSTRSDDNADRLGSLDWCLCGNCSLMPTIEECRCCSEIHSVLNTKDDIPGIQCITDHPGFGPVCLDIYVLRTSYFQYRQLHGEIPECPERYRYTAYRQFVRWCWGYLGKSIRVPLPACAVKIIRETFPAPNGNFKGFNFVH
ncbi:P2X purinoceptor 7-like [Ylistrum balloti]|uniref:P2X purinoceptor 7-like n=1 Tax=Ylistrum balloti TaxID=509963 RepID=UPI00290590C2|nr:P2X purinoceptor 7-like [Ylistrum balloti]XP_060078197.1 P2X purinoceptor 7-like [Ylistrum balloti]XP_060078412.1 P2X purinoceptor 7-like [Ylistrum balloti]XP_060080502.1 P2X purinoceptor 7-like [Ylistrum balloti]